MEKIETKLNSSVVSSFLIADPSSSRKSIRQLLSQLGMKPNQVDIAEGIGDALEIVQTKKTQVIFLDQTLVGTRLSEMIQLQEQSIPPGSAKALFLLTSTGSHAEASGAADVEVDAVIVRPFTFNDLKDRVQTVLEEKFFPKPHQQLINQALGFLKTDQLESAYSLFKKAQEMSPDVMLVYSYMGLILTKQGKYEDAQEILKKGLKRLPTHYRCLLGQVELLTTMKNYQAAYKSGRTLAEHHPVPIKQLPTFIKLSILNAQYEDIFEFYKLIDGIDGVDEEVSSYLAAGLVVGGLFCLRSKKPKEAVEIFKKAQRMGSTNLRILCRILQALGEEGLETEVNAMLTRMPKEIQDSKEIRVAQLTSLKTSNPALALNTALALIRDQVREVEVLRVAIQLSVQTKRPQKAIDGLLEVALQWFPDHKEEWDRSRLKIE